MKRKIYFTSVLLSFLLVSCGNTNNYGYPSKIAFDKMGGGKICSGTSSCYSIDINDYQGNGNAILSQGENDTIIATCDWLSVKFRKSTGAQLKMTALPNTTGKKRTLYVTGWVDNSFADIKVIQY